VPALREASVDGCTLSNRLSVRDLRAVIRVRDLLPADHVNVRKPVLCHTLQEHVQTECMQAIWQQYMATRQMRRAKCTHRPTSVERAPDRQTRRRRPADKRSAKNRFSAQTQVR
jgi:hypothetical protein